MFFCYLASGLSLVLNIEADDYYEDFSESYGAVVDVTSTMEMHFPEENRYLIAPGQATNIGFTKVSLPKFLAGFLATPRITFTLQVSSFLQRLFYMCNM